MIKILAKIDNFLQLTCEVLVIFLGNLREFDEHGCKFQYALSFTHFSALLCAWGLNWIGCACDLCILPIGEFLQWEGNGQVPWVCGSGMRWECFFSSCLAGSFHSQWLWFSTRRCNPAKQPLLTSPNSFAILPIPLSLAFSLRVAPTSGCH